MPRRLSSDSGAASSFPQTTLRSRAAAAELRAAQVLRQANSDENKSLRPMREEAIETGREAFDQVRLMQGQLLDLESDAGELRDRQAKLAGGQPPGALTDAARKLALLGGRIGVAQEGLNEAGKVVVTMGQLTRRVEQAATPEQALTWLTDRLGEELSAGIAEYQAAKQLDELDPVDAGKPLTSQERAAAVRRLEDTIRLSDEVDDRLVAAIETFVTDVAARLEAIEFDPTDAEKAYFPKITRFLLGQQAARTLETHMSTMDFPKAMDALAIGAEKLKKAFPTPSET